MKYLLIGNPTQVAHVIRENRIRVQRGVIKFIPFEPDTVLDTEKKDSSIEDVGILKEENGKLKERIKELEEIVASVENEKVDSELDSEETNTVENSMDDKIIEDEDSQEVDLDEDDKTVSTDDVKDISTDDVKETKSAKASKKRTKKSE